MIFTEFLESLHKQPLWKERSAQIDAWVSAGKLRDLRRVLAVLADDETAGKIDASVKRTVLQAIEYGLCRTPGLANAELALEIAVSPFGSAPQRSWLHPQESLRHVASLLASAQPPEVLFALFRIPLENPKCREVLACLIQEMIVRRIDVTGPPAAFQDGLRREGHPLGRLPLTLLRQEETLPTFFSSYVSGKLPLGGRAAPLDPIEPPSDEAIPIAWSPLAMSEDDLRMLRSAFDNWIGHSNGRVELAAFTADRLLEGGDIAPDILQALPLKCLEDCTPESLALYRASALNIFSELFLSAAHGAAYSPGYYSAYGRLDAWRTVRGFIGCRDASFEDLSREMDRCAWFAFSPTTPWFYRVAWDVGFLALRSDKKTLVALAATDTD